MDVGEDTTLGDGDVTQELVQLLIVPDGELEMTGNNTGLLVVTGGVTSQLENFGSEILKHSREVDGSTGTDTLGVVALPEKTVDTTNGEGKTSLGRSTLKFQVSMTCHFRLFWYLPTSNDVTRYRALKKGHKKDLRLRVLGTAGLATRLAASSHFD